MVEKLTEPANANEFQVYKLKFEESEDENSVTEILVKKYKSEKKSPDKPIGKTLQVQNIPPYATKEAIKRIFEIAGEVESVNIFDKWENERKWKSENQSKFFKNPMPYVFKIGIIVYKKSSSVDVFLRCKKLPPLSTPENPILTGIESWDAEMEEYVQRVDHVELKAEVDDYMMKYDENKAREEANQPEVDDEGWTIVPKKGQNSGFKQTDKAVKRLQEKANKQKKGLKNFYSFELRESKKQELATLKRKFEQDKKNLDSMKKRKAFMK